MEDRFVGGHEQGAEILDVCRRSQILGDVERSLAAAASRSSCRAGSTRRGRAADWPRTPYPLGRLRTARCRADPARGRWSAVVPVT
jgi:hypothetical protein